MKIPRIPLFSVFTLTVVLLVGFAVLYWFPDDELENDLRRRIRVQQLAGDILHLDEVLTMSARMAAVTGDLKWEERYRLYEPKLDQAIGEAMKLARSAIMSEASAATFDANAALVQMEVEVFTLVRKGDLEAANEVITSETYENQKQIYAQSLTRIVTRVHEAMDESLESHQQRDTLVFGLFASSLLLAALFWISSVFHKPKKQLGTD